MAKICAECPHCQTEIHVYTEWEGEAAICPFCGEDFVITIGEGLKSDPEDIPWECPECHARQNSPYRQKTLVCSSCGHSSQVIRNIAFRCAKTLAPGEDGSSRVACPFCGAHYQLNFIPHMGLVGCQNCMNIFSCTLSSTEEEAEAVSASAETVSEAEDIPVGILLSDETIKIASPIPGYISVKSVPDMIGGK